MKNVGIFYVHLDYIFNSHLVNVMAILVYIYFGHFGIFCGHLVYIMAIWYIAPDFGLLNQEKSCIQTFTLMYIHSAYVHL
jgi:hypothetical protein